MLILTKMVIAGVAEHIFPAIATVGFNGISLSALQLMAAIKKSIKQVDHKVSVGLVEHFKTATRDFDEALIQIECEMYDEANICLRKVIDEAGRAFSIREGLDENIDRVPLASYRELMNSAKMLIFSKILVYSYDEDMDTYLPCQRTRKNCWRFKLLTLPKHAYRKRKKSM